MNEKLNPLLTAIEDPPIDEVQQWIRGRAFPEDKPLIDLSQALPSYPPAAELRNHMAELVVDPTMSGYTEIGGIPELKEAYANEVSQFYQTRVSSEEVFITAGCNQAFFLSMLTLGKAGDEVILPAPYYFNHRMTLEMLGMTPVLLPCRPKTGMLPEVDIAEMLITPQTRGIVLVTPNNPSGTVYPSGLIEDFYRLAQAKGLYLILDETYRDFLNPEQGLPHHLLNLSWQENLVQLYSFSKSFALAGYRIGAITASSEFLKELVKVMDCAAICAPKLVQRTALYALMHLHDWREEKKHLMNLRAESFRRYFQESNRSRFRLSTLGPCFAYIRHSEVGKTAYEVAKKLALNENLLLLPGSMFGPDQDSYLRIAFANVEIERFPEMMTRFENFAPEN